MQIDLHTLYFLTVGTLVVAAAMLLWERSANPFRARELGLWAGGAGLFVGGCLAAMNRTSFPGILGPAAANLSFVAGYLLWLHGARLLDGPAGGARWYAAALGGLALLWALAGTHFPQAIWNHVASLPVAVATGLTALAILRCRAMRGLRSRPLAVAIPLGHAGFYLARAVVVPPLAAAYGADVVSAVAKATMYEAVLYSVAMPMAFVALIREEAQDRLRDAARTDYLTGLSNRHGFFEQGDRMLAERAADAPVSLLAFDLDHFKTINDRYGHAAGDAVIRLFAIVARELTRDADDPEAIVARLGGEEFAALLPGRGLAEARRIGEEVALRFAEASTQGIRATVSIGLAEARPGRGDLVQLLDHADRALYRAKALGRNRIEVAGPAAA
ncbi:sensor domain-containing diguanylate cyclase [Methylobacterium sp. J-076]|uniref:GGDEF domain-containing protein n=1 Tax=Methylobacterium sp. J-076 TaxID=2836655 RepID=UPI001FBB691F|nr:GGDEF domain-containing protein [Methylobacterium sp. J-076]MCJ2013274.1 GGDEF domain-containing protein [Methylobacterium sp. J-076]